MLSNEMGIKLDNIQLPTTFINVKQHYIEVIRCGYFLTLNFPFENFYPNVFTTNRVS